MCLRVTNALAYSVAELIVFVKCFVVEDRRGRKRKNKQKVFVAIRTGNVKTLK
jgi:hypothetical protein